MRIRMDAPRAWGIYFQDSATPVRWFGKLLMRVKLPNSGNILKLLVPNYNIKVISRWSNYSNKVISQKMMETKMGDRGSKPITYVISTISHNVIVKEQRVDGSYTKLVLRYTLMGF
jgi:hypothetical protein